MPAEMPVLEPQFARNEQQRDASVLGMWVFLGTEVLLFGGIIGAFLATRVFYPFEFEHAAGRLNVLIGGINTLVLLASSLTMALAVHAAQTGNRRLLMLFLAFTATIGAAFLGLKFYEYYTDWRDGLVPMTDRFHAEEAEPRILALFMMFYFILTGLHAIHLTLGIGIVGWLFGEAWRGDRPRAGASVTEVVGLYWHFVDIVWIFLLPVLYLSGHHVVSDLHL